MRTRLIALIKSILLFLGPLGLIYLLSVVLKVKLIFIVLIAVFCLIWIWCIEKSRYYFGVYFSKNPDNMTIQNYRARIIELKSFIEAHYYNCPSKVEVEDSSLEEEITSILDRYFSNKENSCNRKEVFDFAKNEIKRIKEEVIKDD